MPADLTLDGSMVLLGKTVHERDNALARVKELEDVLKGLVDAVANMRVPQNTADAALQVFIVGPVFERARAALEQS